MSSPCFSIKTSSGACWERMTLKREIIHDRWRFRRSCCLWMPAHARGVPATRPRNRIEPCDPPRSIQRLARSMQPSLPNSGAGGMRNEIYVRLRRKSCVSPFMWHGTIRPRGQRFVSASCSEVFPKDMPLQFGKLRIVSLQVFGAEWGDVLCGWNKSTRRRRSSGPKTAGQTLA